MVFYHAADPNELQRRAEKHRKEQKKARQELRERQDKEKTIKERCRMQKLGATNPLIYIVDQLINFTIQKKDRLQLEPRPLEDLGIPDDQQKIVDAHDLLIQMKNFGCFNSVDKRQWNFVIVKPDLNKLKEYKIKLQNNLDDTNKSPEESNTIKMKTNSEEQHCETINYKNNKNIVEVKIDSESKRIISVIINNKYLRTKKGELRRGDIIFLGELIKRQGGVVIKGILKESMGYEDLDSNDRVLYDASARIKKYTSLNFIKCKRGEGYYLE